LNQRKLLKDIGIVTVVLGLARVFGFVRDTIMLPRFGMEKMTDAWNISSKIPMTISVLLMTGVFSAVFIPIFTKYIVNKDFKGLTKLVGVLFTVITVGFTVIMILGMIFAEPIVKYVLTSPGANPEMLETAINLFRIMMPAVLLMAWSGLLTGIHQSFQRFTLPAVGNLLLNLSFIAALVFLPKSWGIYVMAYGLLVGSFLLFVVQLPGVFGKNLKLNINVDLKHPALTGIGSLIIPVLLGSGISYIIPFFENYIASALMVGSVTAYTTAWKVSQLPLSIFIMTISTVIFPQFSTSVALNRPEALKYNIIWGLKLVAFIIIPCGIGILALAEPMVVTLFLRGEFTMLDAIRVAQPLSIYAIALLPWAFSAVLVKVFYSMGDTKTPVWIALISVTLLVALELIFVRIWNVMGMAIGSATAAFVSMLLQLVMVRKKIGNFGISSLLISVIKSTISAGVMGVVAFYTSHRAMNVVNQATNTGRILSLTFAIVAGIIVYIGMMYLINRAELREVFSALSRKEAV